MAVITPVLLFVAALVALSFLFKSRKGSGPKAPGPRPWPIIGNLAYIGKFRDLTDAFMDLKQKYGSVASLKLGVHNAVVICGLKNFREVLVDRAQSFDARPAFKRYYLLFGGSKDNSLAFADGNDSHHKHRAAISYHTFAKNGSANFEQLENATTDHVFRLIENIKNQTRDGQSMDIKIQVAETIASIFMKYFTDIDVDPSDELFQEMIKAFDIVFQEINTGCVGDVLPFLMPFINKDEYGQLSAKVRAFTSKRCFEPVLKQRNQDQSSDENNNSAPKVQGKGSNVINSLLDLIETNKDVHMDHVFYAFEDILGGHSAVANSLVRMLVHLSKNPQVQRKIREEVQNQSSGFPSMSDRLTYTEAAVWECFRFISSPIVPHVATHNTTINDIPVSKGTVVFFNNHDMNFSPQLWENPESFTPERFIAPQGGVCKKPEYFLPFSTGKRNCLGYKMAVNVCKVIIANLCQNFEIQLDPKASYDMERGVIAVGRDKSFPFIYKPVVE